ncbi:MAG: hypothetical protein N3C57_05585 [Aquificaceae bacterium]|nr:hypothetical protein [Aquificaceae bacterium]MCX8076488.1 hypothetical protein [Aquificaceae bacterium]
MKEVEAKKLKLSGEVALDESSIQKSRDTQRRLTSFMQSKRYQKLNHRLREYVKSEIRRILNRVVELCCV